MCVVANFVPMRKQERYDFFVRHFSAHQPEADTELVYANDYELIVAVILSAQCTDVRVNKITPHLFDHYPNYLQLAQATFDELQPFIASCSYPNNKTKHLINMANMVIDDFKGELPREVDELVKLPGVGRKTANVVASVLYDKPAMAVDTHVFRVAARIGLTTRAKTPLQAEKQLVKYLPETVIARAHHWLILHGRYVCKARKPNCDDCALTSVCAYYTRQAKKKGK